LKQTETWSSLSLPDGALSEQQVANTAYAGPKLMTAPRIPLALIALFLS
jgi:hypothetical protein